MKLLNYFTVAGLIFISASVMAQNSSGEDGFSLQECIDYAMKNNPNIINSAFEKDIADTQVKETLSTGLPQANVDLGINYNFEPQKSLIDISTFDPTIPEGTEQEVSFQQQYDGNLVFSVRQLIFDGSFFVGLQAAHTFKELSTKEHIKNQIDVVEAVSKAYYTALVTKERLDLLEVNLDRLDSLLSDTKAMYETGFVEKIDVSRLKVQHNNLNVQVKSTRELYAISFDLLKYQMGMPISEDIALNDKLEEIQFDLSEEEVFAYDNRIEYSQLQTNLALLNLDIKNNKVQYLPNLYANFNYGFNTQTSESNQWFQRDRWLSFGFVGLSLNIPVFDGFLKRSRIQKSKIQISQTEQSFKLLENTIDLEIKQSKVNMSNALDNMIAQKENMELSQDIYRVTKIKYQEGLGSNLEVLEADEDVKESQTNYYNALYDALIAKVEFEKAQGKLFNNE